MKNVEMKVNGDILTITVDLSKEFGPSASEDDHPCFDGGERQRAGAGSEGGAERLPEEAQLARLPASRAATTESDGQTTIARPDADARARLHVANLPHGDEGPSPMLRHQLPFPGAGPAPTPQRGGRGRRRADAARAHVDEMLPTMTLVGKSRGGPTSWRPGGDRGGVRPWELRCYHTTPESPAEGRAAGARLRYTLTPGRSRDRGRPPAAPHCANEEEMP